MKNDIKLKIEIQNKEPITLADLTIALNSFADLYTNFTKDKANLIVEK